MLYLVCKSLIIKKCRNISSTIGKILVSWTDLINFNLAIKNEFTLIVLTLIVFSHRNKQLLSIKCQSIAINIIQNQLFNKKKV